MSGSADVSRALIPPEADDDGTEHPDPSGSPGQPSDSRPHFEVAQSRLMNLAVWILMSLAQLPIIGMVLQHVQSARRPTGLVLLLLVPLPALVIGLFGYRSERPVPEDRVIRDWGIALGWGFVQTGRRTYWVKRESVAALGRDPVGLAPLALKPDIDGFELTLPPRTSGRADIVIVALQSAVATTAPWSLVMLGIMVSHAEALSFVALWLLMSLLFVSGVFLLQLPALVPLAIVYESYRSSVSQITLRGRKLTVDGKEFLLGQPDERIQHGPPGTLTLTNRSQRLVVSGQAAILEQLAPVLRGVTAGSDGSGDASEVPEGLTSLEARRTERAR